MLTKRCLAFARNSVQPFLVSSRRFTQDKRSLPSFVFDIDGVLLYSKEPLPGAYDILSILQGNNKKGIKFPFIFMTNGGGYLESARAKMLSDIFGLQFSPKQVQLSHTVFRDLVPDYKDVPILALGGNPDIKSVAKEYGFNHVHTPPEILTQNPTQFPYSVYSPKVDYNENLNGVSYKALFVFSDSFDWQRDIQLITDAALGKDGVLGTIRKKEDPQIPIYISNGDLLWVTGYSTPRYGTGAFAECASSLYKTRTGWDLEYTVFGKPTPVAYNYAKKKLADIKRDIAEDDSSDDETILSSGDIYMVGDNPVTDIMGANNAGLKSILVRTGVYDGIGNDKENPATYVAEGVYDGVKHALKKAGFEDIF